MHDEEKYWEKKRKNEHENETDLVTEMILILD